MIHYSKDKTSLINAYFWALIPLLIFGFYKNGILLYKNDLINFVNMFIPLIFFIESIIVSFIISYITKENLKENILLSLIISSTISINTNLIIYPILLFATIFIVNYISANTRLTFNKLALIRLFLIFGLLINSYSYLNIGEKLDVFNYNLFDVFLGLSSGGIASTSTLLLIISFIILCTNKFYKRAIPLMASISFIITSFIYILISNNETFINAILNGSVYFSFIFVAATLYTTPYNKKSMAIYGILIGFLTSLISIIFNFYEAGFISILLVSIFIPFINKLGLKHFL